MLIVGGKVLQRDEAVKSKEKMQTKEMMKKMQHFRKCRLKMALNLAEVFSSAILPKGNIRFLYKILDTTCIELAIVYMSVTFELTHHH